MNVVADLLLVHGRSQFTEQQRPSSTLTMYLLIDNNAERTKQSAPHIIKRALFFALSSSFVDWPSEIPSEVVRPPFADPEYLAQAIISCDNSSSQYPTRIGPYLTESQTIDQNQFCCLRESIASDVHLLSE